MKTYPPSTGGARSRLDNRHGAPHIAFHDMPDYDEHAFAALIQKSLANASLAMREKIEQLVSDESLKDYSDPLTQWHLVNELHRLTVEGW